MGLALTVRDIRALALLFCLLATLSLAWPGEKPATRLTQAPEILLVDAGVRGPIVEVEFIGNTSRLNAFLGVSSAAEISQVGPRVIKALPKDYFQARYPYFRKLRIGNLFFGYECMGSSFQELAVRGSDGAVRYQFEETIRLVEELLRGGLKPHFALTGLPKPLVADGEKVISHPAYGCVNAPTFDWSKTEPRERVRAWWQLQDAFMRALIAHFGKDEVKTWEFATWTEPLNPEGKMNAHLVLPASVIKAGRHDEAVATIIAASIDAAMTHGLPIHIGNFAGAVEQAYPKIIAEIRRFPQGEAYLKYISGYAISRYRVKPTQNIGNMLDSAFNLLSDPTMPDKPLFIDEFGELTGDDGIAPWRQASSLEGATFVGTVLARVFDRQDGTIRVPMRIAFWNNYITPRAKNAFTLFDDYLKTPASNVVAMFASMNGHNKLHVSGRVAKQAIAGMKAGRVKIILLSDLARGWKSELRPEPQAENSAEIHIGGLKANTSYQVISSTLNGRYGNPISVFLGGEVDYRQDPRHRFSSDNKKWTLASPLLERCFFDEIKQCIWREQAHRIDSPLLRLENIRSDALGVLRVPANLTGAAVVMMDVEGAGKACGKVPRPVALNFDSGIEPLMRAQLKAMQNVSFDAGASLESGPIRNDERNQGLRFHESARFVLPCSPFKARQGRVRLAFKANSEAMGKKMTLVQQGDLGSADLRITIDNGNLGVESAAGGAVRVAAPLPETKRSEWNALDVVTDGKQLRVWLNGQMVGRATLPHDGKLSAVHVRQPVFIGTSSNFADAFQGVIDDLQLE